MTANTTFADVTPNANWMVSGANPEYTTYPNIPKFHNSGRFWNPEGVVGPFIRRSKQLQPPANMTSETMPIDTQPLDANRLKRAEKLENSVSLISPHPAHFCHIWLAKGSANAALRTTQQVEHLSEVISWGTYPSVEGFQREGRHDLIFKTLDYLGMIGPMCDTTPAVYRLEIKPITYRGQPPLSEYPVVREFAKGTNGVEPEASVVAMADRIVRTAHDFTVGPHITVDDESGDLDFHLRLTDNLLVMANLFPDGTIDASVYDDSQGVPVKTVKRMRRTKASEKDLISLFQAGINASTE